MIIPTAVDMGSNPEMKPGVQNLKLCLLTFSIVIAASKRHGADSHFEHPKGNARHLEMTEKPAISVLVVLSRPSRLQSPITDHTCNSLHPSAGVEGGRGRYGRSGFRVGLSSYAKVAANRK